MKLLSQRIPYPTFFGVAYEYTAAVASVYLAGLARFGLVWPSQGDMAPSAPKALLFGVLTVIGFAAMGLYQTDYRRLSKEAVAARIAAGLALAGLVDTAVFFVVPELALG